MNMTNELKNMVQGLERLKVFKKQVQLLENGYTEVNFNDIIYSIDEQIEKIELTPVLAVSIQTGFYWLNTFYTIGNENSDLMAILDEYATEENCILKFYEIEEIIEIVGTEDFYEDDYFNESFLPINGGAVYTDIVERVEPLTIYELVGRIKENENN